MCDCLACVCVRFDVLLQEKLVRTNTVTSRHQSIWQLDSERDSQNVLNNSNCMLDNNNLHISLFWHISVGGEGENTFPFYVFFSHHRTWPLKHHNTMKWTVRKQYLWNTRPPIRFLLPVLSDFLYFYTTQVYAQACVRGTTQVLVLFLMLHFSSPTHTHRQLAQYKESHHSLSVIPEASLYRPDSH